MSMRRTITASIALTLAALTAAPAASAAKPAHAWLARCQHGAGTADRYAVFVGSMARLPGADRMQMRVDVAGREGNAPFHAVSAPNLGVWRTAKPGVDLYKRVLHLGGLAAPGAYRATMRFRWQAGDQVVARARRVTALCVLPDMRPDLRVLSIFRPSPGDGRLEVIVRNAGATASGGFDVALDVGGTARPARAVGGLAPGERAIVTWSGASCSPGQGVTATADSGHVVGESNEANNSLAVACPA
jgi:hypothetical protein